MKTTRLLLIVLTLGAQCPSTVQAADCPYLTGYYVWSAADAGMSWTIRQVNCSHITITKEAGFMGVYGGTNYADSPIQSEEVLPLETNGAWQVIPSTPAAQSGSPARPKENSVQALWIKDKLAVKRKQGSGYTIETYSLDPSGNLRLENENINAAGQVRKKWTTAIKRRKEGAF